VADGLAVGEGAALADQRAWLLAHRTGAAAVRTGVVGGEGLGLLLQEGGQRALGPSVGRRGGDLLHSGEVDVAAGAGVADGAARHDLAPPGSQVTEILEFLGCQG
jgi:hypothetical protein